MCASAEPCLLVVLYLVWHSQGEGKRASCGVGCAWDLFPYCVVLFCFLTLFCFSTLYTGHLHLCSHVNGESEGHEV